MSSEKTGPVFDLVAMTSIRPSEIKTYRQTTYDRISPSTTTFDGKGKTVFITAGATGIGLAIAQSFAQAGVEHLVILQRRQAVLDEAEQLLNSKYPNVKVTKYAASVTDLDRISSIIKEVGKIDVLAANAGGTHPFAPGTDLTTAEFQLAFDLNVVSTFHIIKEFLALESSGPRQIIYTSSAAGQVLVPGSIGYGPSKLATNLMIQYFARENADRDVVFQSFHPGIIQTELSESVTGEGTFAWEDLSLPGDFALWLASPEAKFLNGKFVWAQWDVDELLTLKERIAANPFVLTTTIAL